MRSKSCVSWIFTTPLHLKNVRNADIIALTGGETFDTF